jgi:general stress protein 26
VHLGYTDLESFRFISMTGEAQIVRDVEKKKELWVEDIEQWFEDGPEDEDVLLLKVTPSVVSYWSGEEQDEIELRD